MKSLPGSLSPFLLSICIRKVIVELKPMFKHFYLWNKYSGKIDKLECSSKNVLKHLSLKHAPIVVFLPITLPREPLLKGKAQYGWPPHYGSCFCKKGTRYLGYKRKFLKLVSTRRATVLCFRLLWGFLTQNFV